MDWSHHILQALVQGRALRCSRIRSSKWIISWALGLLCRKDFSYWPDMTRWCTLFQSTSTSFKYIPGVTLHGSRKRSLSTCLCACPRDWISGAQQYLLTYAMSGSVLQIAYWPCTFNAWKLSRYQCLTTSNTTWSCVAVKGMSVRRSKKLDLVTLARHVSWA